MIDVGRRAELLARGAAEWRDPSSGVRAEARDALRGAPWSAPVVEAALDNVLWDLDEARVRAVGDVADHHRSSRETLDDRPVLVILPGNVIGPAIASAYCAAAMGTRAILKSAAAEHRLAGIVARQFDRLGPPLAGTIEARYWKGGDESVESQQFASVSGMIAFGSSETIADLQRRAPDLNAAYYRDSYSVGVVGNGADVPAAARGAARDVCIFDQSGCMSPQTIYVEGDEGRALLFAHALFAALRGASTMLPQVRTSRSEAGAIAARVRELRLTALPPKTHGLETLLLGPTVDGCPDFVVAVEAAGPPSISGLGRIVVVKPVAGAEMLRAQLASFVGELDTAGTAGRLSPALGGVLAERFLRTCALGEMQRPPFGYRPSADKFLDVRRRAAPA